MSGNEFNVDRSTPKNYHNDAMLGGLLLVFVVSLVILLVPTLASMGNFILAKVFVVLSGVLPAFWLWYQYCVLWYRSPSENEFQFKAFQYDQQVTRNLWLAIYSILLILYFSGNAPGRAQDEVNLTDEVEKHFLVGTGTDGYAVCRWGPEGQIILRSFEDDRVRQACERYLLEQELAVPAFDQAGNLAKQHGWPGANAQ